MIIPPSGSSGDSEQGNAAALGANELNRLYCLLVCFLEVSSFSETN